MNILFDSIQFLSHYSQVAVIKPIPVDLAKGTGHTFVVLEIFFPKLTLVSLDKPLVEFLATVEYSTAFMLEVECLSLVEPEVILRVLTQAT